MQFSFDKYQGTGNDFIMIDDRNLSFPLENTSFIEACCDRRFGIGADGLILIQPSATSDFKMVYFNSDGRESTLCGNGARCTVAFAKALGIIENTTTFDAIDGIHTAAINEEGSVALRMHDVTQIELFDTHQFLDTGSPHHVMEVEALDDYPVVEMGRKIRYGAPYHQAGSNVNFVTQVNEDTFTIRTYERGVEDETLSCGTGATAVALAMHKTGTTQANTIGINVKGGFLKIKFKVEASGYTEIDLIGPANFVFSGQWKS